MRLSYSVFYFSVLTLIACNNTHQTASTNSDTNFAKGSYGYDVAFIKKHAGNTIELTNGNAKVLLSADYQGRVFTSTASGDTGISFGWINYNLLSSGEKKKQFNPVGGEERFWLGPEGGQYSLYFKKNDSFNINHWQVPAVVDTEKYNVDESDNRTAIFSKAATLTNYSGATFNLQITRKVRLLSDGDIQQKLKTTIPSNIKSVVFESVNQITNTGNNAWKKDSGLISIWLLGMFTPTDETKVIIPFSPQKNARSFITDDYFGKVAADRLLIKDSVLYFRCDGKARGKIGLSPEIAKRFICSYDFKRNVLTILIPQVQKGERYVNSKWQLQKEPYKGDVINSYNDGPLADGTQMGPFYEVESSSSAQELNPGERQEYRQTTIHLQSDYATLKNLVKQMINVDLDDVKKW